MPATRQMRSVRRKAAARTILGALDENEPSAASDAAASVKSTGSAASENITCDPSDTMQLPSDFDGSDPSTIRLLLEDISREVKKRQDSIALLADQAKSEQQGLAFVHKMKIQKNVREMTLRDFDAKFGCDILAEVRRAMTTGGGGETAPSAAGKKRDRPGGSKAGATKGKVGGGGMALETPAPKGGGIKGRAPGTAMRTVRRGEAMFSVNGSPVDKSDEGALIATVCKKRKAGGNDEPNNGGAIFDINVGDGRYVNLTDPGTVQHLDQDMKNTAMSQLKILQDQMASLMAQLGN